MSKTIVVVGFGPGISTAVAEKFGTEGFRVALVARSKDRLASGVAALKTKDISAAAFPADAGDPVAIRAAIAKVRSEFGPITAIHWNAYGGGDAGDLLTAEPGGVRGVFDVAIVGLLSVVQEALSDLKQTNGALLVTNGAFGELTPQIDELATNMKVMGLALANAAKHKLVGLLVQRLKGEGVYVGEVMVAGIIKGTAWDRGNGIPASRVAEAFWTLFETRQENYARVS
jgi:NAD(P)-dependent dehydrogenase (short-subunit alcohol dehydrogenase family)